jgi:DNA-binding GntR family transcriptional regulator
MHVHILKEPTVAAQQVGANAVDAAYTHLRAQILSGLVRPGERILEADIAAQAQISRTPVREALRRLHAEGLVNIIANKGARVAALDAADRSEIFALRSLIEPYAAGEAARLASPDEIADMRVASTEMQRIVDQRSEGWSRRLTRLNREFHRMIMAAAGNRRLSAIAQNLMEPGLMHATFEQYSADELRRSMQHHDELVTAIESRNAMWASSVMQSHLIAAAEVSVRRHDIPAAGD